MTRRRLAWPLLVLVRVVVLAASIGVALGLADLGLRVYQRLALGLPMGNDALWTQPVPQATAGLPNLFDSRLGWRPADNFVLKTTAHREDGTPYPLHVTQGRHGFRRFGTGQGPRTFVVGDSYTQALDVSDERTFYALLEKQLGLQTYAIGSAGYGTLQEELLLEQYWDEIKPELVVWQFCYNDFMNNSYELEDAWTAGNFALHERPYLEGDAVRFRTAGPAERLRTWAQHETRLYEFVAGRLARLTPAGHDQLVDDIIAMGKGHRGFRNAAATTDRLFDRIAARVGGTPVVVFEACTTAEPFYPTLEDIVRRHNMHFAPDLPGNLNVAQQQGARLLAADHVHWNEEAQVIIAAALVPSVQAALGRPAPTPAP